MSKKLMIIGGVAVIGVMGFFILKGERSTVSPAQTKSPESVYGPVQNQNAAGMPGGQKSGARAPASHDLPALRAQIRSLSKVAPDFKGEKIAEWGNHIRMISNRKERSEWVKLGLSGFRSLDSDQKRMFALPFAMAVINVDDPLAKKFINDLAKHYSSESNLLLNMLTQASPETVRADYPQLLSTAAQWVKEHREFKLDPSIGNLRALDSGAAQAIEGSKLVALEVASFKYFLKQVR